MLYQFILNSVFDQILDDKLHFISASSCSGGQSMTASCLNQETAQSGSASASANHSVSYFGVSDGFSFCLATQQGRQHTGSDTAGQCQRLVHTQTSHIFTESFPGRIFIKIMKNS